MGMFAETANVDYRLSFADQGKYLSVLCSQKINGSLPFPFSVRTVCAHIYIETAAYIYIYIYLCIYIVVI